jgi:hypothetical protein
MGIVYSRDLDGKNRALRRKGNIPIARKKKTFDTARSTGLGEEIQRNRRLV